MPAVHIGRILLGITTTLGSRVLMSLYLCLSRFCSVIL